MKMLLAVLFLMASPRADIIDDIVFFCGVQGPEDLSESEVERFQHLADHPVELNSATKNGLSSTGLLSPYQIASLLDWRARTGGILSFTELSVLDGFNPEFVAHLRRFASIDPVLRKDSDRLDIADRQRVSFKSGSQASYLRKSSFSAGERIDGCLSIKGDDVCASSVRYRLRSCDASFIAGDFNARFGQGLLLWSGFSMSGVQSSSSLCRNPTGLSPTSSVSSESHFRGAAFSFSRGCLSADAFCTFDGLAAVRAVCRTMRSDFALSAMSSLCLSADWKTSLRHFTFAGECAADFRSGSAAALATILWSPAWKRTIGISGRWYPQSYTAQYAGALRSWSKTSDERGIGLVAECGAFGFTADLAQKLSKPVSSHKATAVFAPASPVLLGPLALRPLLRGALRWRPADADPLQTALRLQTALSLPLQSGGAGEAGGPDASGESPSALSGSFRLDLLRCRELSWQWFAELGYAQSGRGKPAFYIGGGIFKVDNWQDRIYLYRRDVSGAFNVQALYGRGYIINSLVKWNGLSCSFSRTAYPWMNGAKQSAFAVKVQYDWEGRR